MDMYGALFAKATGGGGNPPVLIDKNITANGTYNAADDEADGYKKVVVDVAGENNMKYIFLEEQFGVEFRIINSGFTIIEIPEGYTSFYDLTSGQSIARCTRAKVITIPSTFQGITNNAFANLTQLEKIIIKKPEGSISGAPWGAPSSCEIIWNG